MGERERMELEGEIWERERRELEGEIWEREREEGVRRGDMGERERGGS